MLLYYLCVREPGVPQGNVRIGYQHVPGCGVSPYSTDARQLRLAEVVGVSL